MSKISIFFSHAIAAALLISSPASLFASWTTPVQISTSNSDQVDIAVDVSGNAVGIWQGYDGYNYIIQSSSLPEGGNWSSPTNLSASGADAQAPAVAVDSLGNAVAVWSRFDGNSSIIQANQLPFRGSWGTATNISVSGFNADSVKLSMDNTGLIGNAVAVWHRYNGTNFIVQASELLSGGTWSFPTNISPSGQDALIPDVAVDPNGNAVATCARYDGTNFTTRNAMALKGQSWGPSFVVSNGAETASEGSIAVDSNGNAVAVWSQFDGSNFMVQASLIPYGGNWSTEQAISTSGQDASIPIVASDPNGNIVAIWVAFDGTNNVTQAAMLPSGGSWSAPVTISNEGMDVNNICLAINILGNSVAAWDETDGVNSTIQSASLPLNGSWSTLTQVSTTGNFATNPVVSVDSSGNAVAIWLQTDGYNNYIWGSSLPSGR